MARRRYAAFEALVWLAVFALSFQNAEAQAPSRSATGSAPIAGQKAAPQRRAPPSYGPQRQPLRQAAAPGGNHASPLNQFTPRPRRPQATWGELSAEADAELELVLQAWEKNSSQVKTLESKFTCLKYDKVFGAAGRPGAPPRPTRICQGVIRYAAPDKGHYHITQEAVDPAKEELQFQDIDGEHWVCDGNAVYQFDHEKKQLIERRLPDELKGKAISNSPLPFVFGTTAAKMRQRYWMRLKPVPQPAGKEIWLEVEPIYTEDRANYQNATVILDEKRMLPKALSLKLPNGSHTNYLFDPNPSINSRLKEFWGNFKVPSTPSGWKHVVEEPPAAEPRQPTESAERPRAPLGILRKRG